MMPRLEDCRPWTNVLVGDCWRQLASLDRRSGPGPVCSDAESIAMALVEEGKGWNEETVLLSEWAQRCDLSHNQPTHLRVNRFGTELSKSID
jgi:hypothetical protein